MATNVQSSQERLGWKSTQDREHSCTLFYFVRTKEDSGIQEEFMSSRNIKEKWYKEKKVVAIIVATIMLCLVGQPYIVQEIDMQMHY